jgi:hypothetical protein
VVVGKIAQPPLLIPDSLLLAVVFDDGRIALPSPPPVIGMAGPPFPAAVLTDLTVFRIGGNLLAAIIGAAPSLAFWLTANGLTGLKLRRLEDLLTIATTPFDHTGVVSLNRIGEKSF